MDDKDLDVSGDYQQQATNATARVYSRDEHCVSRKNIDEDALKILRRLNRNGHKAYLVGGGVRDLLLDKEPKDFDIATDATPRKIKALFRNCRIIGRRFKLAHIYFRNRKIIEVSTFRDFHDPIEITDENESQVVQRDNRYGTEATDAWRRDITVNGLFYDLSDFSVIDYVGGMEDLKNKLIRVIGDPDIRFAEDPVRLLRVVRHAGRAQFGIEKSCSESILRNHELILHSSPVRLFEEFKKDLSSGYLLDIFKLSFEHKILQHMLPEFSSQNAKLFADDSEFAQSLITLDSLVQNGSSPTVTASLSVIALHLHSPFSSGEDLAETFMGRDELSDHLSNCFVGLAVPKKERERIEDSIDLWCSLHNSNPEKLRLGNLERRRRIEDVLWIMKIFRLDSGKLFEAVETAAKKRASSSQQKNRKTSGSSGKRKSGKRGGRRNNRRQGSRGGNRGPKE